MQFVTLLGLPSGTLTSSESIVKVAIETFHLALQNGEMVIVHKAMVGNTSGYCLNSVFDMFHHVSKLPKLRDLGGSFP